jgi:hypothetical protein
MTVKEGDWFEKCGQIWEALSDHVDGPTGHRRFFAAGRTKRGEYMPLFDAFRKSRITKRNGWKRIKNPTDNQQSQIKCLANCRH